MVTITCITGAFLGALLLEAIVPPAGGGSGIGSTGKGGTEICCGMALYRSLISSIPKIDKALQCTGPNTREITRQINIAARAAARQSYNGRLVGGN